MGMTDTIEFKDLIIENGHISITGIRIVPYRDKEEGVRKYHFKLDYSLKSGRNKKVFHNGQYSGGGFEKSDINITRFDEILKEKVFPNATDVSEEEQQES